jgi:hypothetical protein
MRGEQSKKATDQQEQFLVRVPFDYHGFLRLIFNDSRDLGVNLPEHADSFELPVDFALGRFFESFGVLF